MTFSISRLPSSSSRLINSHVVVVTPVLLVKELLDNAIDAKATAVEVLISPDTISRIEVRDDGVGIHPNDYDALGKHGHTSKLRNIEELESIAGKTLGFRGEALASVNSIANVTVTTKTATEPVATVLQLMPNKGGVLTQNPIAAPEGTTVTVTKLFNRQPVREQMATKDAKKSLDKIQELLRSYAMARPRLKLQFKVLQTLTKTWSYSPKPNATAMDAALQLFGTKVTSNCFFREFRTGHLVTGSNSPPRGLTNSATKIFVFETIFANPVAHLGNVPKRRYISVDGRPINAIRGIAKQLSTIYLEHLKRSTISEDISDSFIRLNICCPPGTYDANIEPSKDNVLFSDNHAILDAFMQLCGETYKPAAPGQQDTLSTAHMQANDMPTINSLGQGNCLHEPQAPKNRLSYVPRNIPSSKLSPNIPLDDPKKSVDQSYIDEGLACDDQEPREAQTLMAFKPINARKFSGYSRPGDSSNSQTRVTPTTNRGRMDMPIDINECPKGNHQQRHQFVQAPQSSHEIMTTTDREHMKDNYTGAWGTTRTTGVSKEPPSLSSPEASLKHTPTFPLTPEPPILRHALAPPGDLDVPRTHQDTQRTRILCSRRPTLPGGPYHSPVASPSESRTQPSPFISPTIHHKTLRRQRCQQSPRTPPSSLKKSRHEATSLIVPTDSEDVDGFRQTKISFGGTQLSRRRDRVSGSASQTQAVSDGPLNQFEPRTKLKMQDVFSTARKNLHYQLSHMADDQLTGEAQGRETQQYRQRSSHQRWPFGTLQASALDGEAPQMGRRPIETSLPVGDPRAYLLRRQKSMVEDESITQPRRLRRVKSSLMPLENIPAELCTRSLSRTINTGISIMDSMVCLMKKYDEYIIYGTLGDGIDMSLADRRVVESQLQRLLTKHKENNTNRDVGGD